jgi:hypothetical protein
MGKIKKIRLVFSCDSRGIHGCWAEYSIENGETQAIGKQAELNDINEQQTVDEFWQKSIKLIKKNEETG